MRLLGRAPALVGLIALIGLASGAQAAMQARDTTLRLDPESRQIRVTDRYSGLSGEAIGFELAPWMTLVEALVDGREVRPERRGQQLRLSMSKTAAGEVALTLEGTIPALHEREARGRSRGAIAGAEGVYLPGWSGWLPLIEADGASHKLTVEVPQPYRAVATGRLLDEQLESQTYRARFSSEDLVEPPSIFAGPYVITEKRDGDLRMRTYFHAELEPLAELYLATAAELIGRYSDQIGAYPYADFHIISAPLPVGLGFPNLTYVGRRVLPLPFMRGRSLAHEILHNWWGNGVAVDYASGNWSEGLTTYLADYALVAEQGAGAAREMRLGWLQNFAALPDDRRVPVRRFIAKKHDAAQVVGYDKVAFIFYMLEAELGEALFNAGVRRFWETHRFEGAAWSDLQDAFEAEASRDLAWFFKQWLERPGAPRVELIEASRQREGDTHGLVMTLRQSAPTYRMRLPVLVETANGSELLSIEVRSAEQRFVLGMTQEPLAVHVDPDFERFRALLPGESPADLPRRDAVPGDSIAAAGRHGRHSRDGLSAGGTALAARAGRSSRRGRRPGRQTGPGDRAVQGDRRFADQAGRLPVVVRDHRAGRWCGHGACLGRDAGQPGRPGSSSRPTMLPPSRPSPDRCPITAAGATWSSKEPRPSTKACGPRRKARSVGNSWTRSRSKPEIETGRAGAQLE